MQITTWAPVIIPTLCRYEHFKRLIESLKSNKYASKTEIYIGLDYPSKDSHWEGYNKIENYIQNNISGFKEIHLIKHQKNLGASANIIFLRQEVLKKHDRFILTEDDNEFSKNYLEYMNICLETYKDNQHILAISGYNYPYDRSQFTGNIFTSDIYFSAWGYGMWSDRLTTIQTEINMDLFKRKYKDRTFMRQLSIAAPNQFCYFVKGMLGYVPELVKNNNISQIDLSYGLYMLMTGKKMIFPVTSKVRNWGYDGSGANCDVLNFDKSKKITHRNFNTACQELDANDSFEIIIPEKTLTQNEIHKIMNVFFELDSKELLRTRIAYLISRLIGINNTYKLLNRK